MGEPYTHYHKRQMKYQQNLICNKNTSITPSVKILLYQYHTIVIIPVSHHSHTIVTPISQQCHINIIPVSHQCHTQCHTIVTPLSHQYHTSITPVLNHCHTSILYLSLAMNPSPSLVISTGSTDIA